MPSPKTLLAALFAASAIARPQEPPKEEPEKPYTPGLCHFHLEEDGPSTGTSAEHNVHIDWFDADNKKFDQFPKPDKEGKKTKTDVQHQLTNYLLRPKGFKDGILMDTTQGEGDSFRGFKFKSLWDNHEWDTELKKEDGGQCVAGGESGDEDWRNHLYRTRKYDCDFSCV